MFYKSSTLQKIIGLLGLVVFIGMVGCEKNKLSFEVDTEGGLWWQDGLQGVGEGVYQVVQGAEGVEVHINLEYKFDQEYVQKWCQNATGRLGHEIKPDEYASSFGICLDDQVSEAANKIASKKFGFVVSWESGSPDWRSGSWVFRYGDLTKARATVFHQDEKYLKAAEFYEQYSRSAKDFYWLAVSAQERVYAAEFQGEIEQYTKALVLFQEAFKENQKLQHLFSLQYAVALIGAGDPGKGHEILHAIKVLSQCDEEEKRLRRRYVAWYQ